MTVVAHTAHRAAALANAVAADAVTVTCRVPPASMNDFAPWIAVHTLDGQHPDVLATGMSLAHRQDRVQAGQMQVRQGPARVLAYALAGGHATSQVALRVSEMAFAYTADLAAHAPIAEAFSCPTDEGFCDCLGRWACL